VFVRDGRADAVHAGCKTALRLEVSPMLLTGAGELIE
jgi:hypothetical protein